jgi:hypothetical protein
VSAPRVVAFGIDTLHLLTRALVAPDAAMVLGDAKQEATDARATPTPICTA